MAEEQAGQPSTDAVSRAVSAFKDFQNIENSQLAVGAAITAPTMQRVKFDGATEIGGMGATSEEIKGRIAACREAYENCGIIGNAIDIMTDFAVEGLEIVHENKSIQRFFNAWATKVNLGHVVAQSLKCYFRDGNVPVLRFRGRIKMGEFSRLKKAVAKDLFDADEVATRIIPYAYSVLDVLELDKVGSELLGNVSYSYTVPPEEVITLKTSAEGGNETLSAAIQRLRSAIGESDYDTLVSSGQLRIPADRLTLLYYKKDDCKKWATPMFWRVIEDIKFKKLLRDMDISVCESVMSTLTIIALGNTPEGFPAPKEMFDKLATLLKTPTKSKTILWNDLIKIIAEYPPVEKILGAEKYTQVDADIRAGIGIAEIILNGQGGNYATSFLSVKTLLERLENGRNEILSWLENELALITKALGFSSMPVVRLAFTSLRDEQAEKQLLLELVDRGMVSYQTCIERFGEDFIVEINRMKEEDGFRRKNERQYPYTLVKTGKFGPSLMNGPIPLMGLLDSDTLSNAHPSQQSPTQQGGEGEKGGRPTRKARQPQGKKETPRNAPRGQKTAASLDVRQVENGGLIFDRLHSILSSSFCKLRNVEALGEKEQDIIYRTIACIISRFTSVDQIDRATIDAAIKDVSRVTMGADLSLYVQDELVKALTAQAHIVINQLNGDVKITLHDITADKVSLLSRDERLDLSSSGIVNLNIKQTSALLSGEYSIEIKQGEQEIRGQLFVVDDSVAKVSRVVSSITRGYEGTLDHGMYRELISAAYAYGQGE